MILVIGEKSLKRGGGMENWSEILEYSESSPSGLVWKIEIKNGKNFNKVLVNPGDIAGTKAHRKNGVPMWWQLGYKGKRYRLHRVLYEIVTGNNPNGYIIDHIDGNPFNNLISNLRLCTSKVNSHNVKSHGRGIGITGVYYEELNGSSYYIAHYTDLDGKLIRKRFNTKYGNALNEAIQYRESAINKLNSQGAGYTDRHGK